MKRTISLFLAVMLLLATAFTANAVQTNQEQEEKLYRENDKNEQIHEGDFITLYFNLGNIDHIGAINSVIKYNTDVLELDDSYGSGDGYIKECSDTYTSVFANVVDLPGQISVAATFNYFGRTHDFKDEPAALVSFKFKAVRDCTEEALGFSSVTSKIIQISENGLSTTTVISESSQTEEAAKYVSLSYYIDCNHSVIDDNTDLIHKGDIITLYYKLGNLDNAASLNSVIDYNTDVLEIDKSYGNGEGYVQEYKDSGFAMAVNVDYTPETYYDLPGQIAVGAIFKPGRSHAFKDEPVALASFKFTAAKDCTTKDLNLSTAASSLTQYIHDDNYDRVQIVSSKDESYKADPYFSLYYIVDCDHTAPTPDYTTDFDVDQPDCTTDIDSDTDSVCDTDTDVYTAPSTDIDTEVSTDTDNTPEPVKYSVGDIDNDGKITSGDSLMVLRHSVKLDTLSPEQQTAADVNRDNKIDSSDALYILRRSVKYSDLGTYFD